MADEHTDEDARIAALVDDLGTKLVELGENPKSVGLAMISSGVAAVIAALGPAEAAKLLRQFADRVAMKGN